MLVQSRMWSGSRAFRKLLQTALCSPATVNNAVFAQARCDLVLSDKSDTRCRTASQPVGSTWVPVRLRQLCRELDWNQAWQSGGDE